MTKRYGLWTLCILLLLSTLACALGSSGEGEPPTPAPAALEPTLAATSTPVPEATPMPTPTEIPTPTPEPVIEELPYEGPVPEGALARIGRGAAATMALSPDGETVAVATAIGVYLYRTDTLTSMWYTPFRSPVVNVVYSPDGARLAALTTSHIHLLDVTQGEMVRERIASSSMAGTAAFSPDGALLATANNLVIQVWDLESGQLLTELSGHAQTVRSLAWTPDGDQLVSGATAEGGQLGEIFVWNPAAGTMIREFGEAHSRSVSALLFSPDGSRMLAKAAREVIMWDFAAGDPLHVIESSNMISVAWSPDAARIAFGLNRGRTAVYDADGPTEAYEVEDQRVNIVAVAFSPDSRLLYTFDSDGTLYKRDAATGEVLGTMSGFANRLDVGVWSPDGRTIWTGMRGLQIVEWDVETFERLYLEGDFGLTGLTGLPISALAYNPDLTLLAVGGGDGRIYLYDPVARQRVAEFGDRDTGHRNAVNRIAWSPDGTLIASSGYDDVVIIWDVDGRVPLLRFEDDNARFQGDVGFTPDGSAVVVTSRDRAIYLLDLESGAIGRQWEQHLERGLPTGLDWHPSEPTQFAVGSINVILWDFTAADAVQLMDEDRAFNFPNALAFSPDGRWIAAGGTSGDVAIWEVATGTVVAAYERPHTSTVSAVAFSPDGGRFATISYDGTILIWATP